MTEHLAVAERTEAALKALRAHAESNRLGGYEPYRFQRCYHSRAEGKWAPPHVGAEEPAGPMARQVLLSCANQAGKSSAGGADTAIHALGDYPEWWHSDWPRLDGLLRKFPDIWCGGQNNDRVRDICQHALVGPPADESAWGTGWIPKERIVDTQRKPGVPRALESVVVKHRAGFNVRISFKAYEAKLLDWAGSPVGLIWLDEEPPQIIYSQCIARTIASEGLIGMTFTPEQGQTAVVSEFWSALKAGQAFILAGWEDAVHEDGRTHLNRAHLERLLAAFLPHEREMRSKGIPVLGAGMVFPIADEAILCEPRHLPASFPRLGGLDFGSGGVNHPTAAAWIAFDRDAHMAYLYDCYKGFATEAAVHAAALKSRGEWIPFAWPHDGNRRESYATEGVAREYRRLGVKLLPYHFENPEGGNAVEPGILTMYQAMQEGRFKVFSTAAEWWQEKHLYHRSEKDSTIVRTNDDVMSAARICFMSPQYAITDPGMRMGRPRIMIAEGAGTWNPTEGM